MMQVLVSSGSVASEKGLSDELVSRGAKDLSSSTRERFLQKDRLIMSNITRNQEHLSRAGLKG